MVSPIHIISSVTDSIWLPVPRAVHCHWVVVFAANAAQPPFDVLILIIEGFADLIQDLITSSQLNDTTNTLARRPFQSEESFQGGFEFHKGHTLVYLNLNFHYVYLLLMSEQVVVACIKVFR